jgi:putative glutamine amidotransferase
MKPLIGITCSRQIGAGWGAYDPGHFMDFNFDEYGRAVLKSGGAPILIPVAQDKGSISSILGHLDGLLLSGGPDVNPRFFKEEPLKGLGPVDEGLDLMELEVTKEALDLDLPVFAICRGIQVLNVALGGTLVQDISRQVENALNHVQQAGKNVNTHTISLEPGSILSSILKRLKLLVNGRHHQAIKDLSSELVVTAKAPDGIIEGVEFPAKRFVLGVQWHPEGTFSTDINSRKLFKAFIEEAAK